MKVSSLACDLTGQEKKVTSHIFDDYFEASSDTGRLDS